MYLALDASEICDGHFVAVKGTDFRRSQHGHCRDVLLLYFSEMRRNCFSSDLLTTVQVCVGDMREPTLHFTLHLLAINLGALVAYSNRAVLPVMGYGLHQLCGLWLSLNYSLI